MKNFVVTSLIVLALLGLVVAPVVMNAQGVELDLPEQIDSSLQAHPSSRQPCSTRVSLMTPKGRVKGLEPLTTVVRTWDRLILGLDPPGQLSAQAA